MYNQGVLARPKQLRWVGSSLSDLRRFPKSVQRHVGRALFAAQSGIEHPDVKALQGFRGRSVLEIRTDDNKNTWRTVYTVRFADVVYVLHAFQKKAKSGIATPRPELELIQARLAAAERHHRERQN